MVERTLDWVEDTRMTQKVMVLLLFAGLASIILYQFVVEPQWQRTQAFEQTLRSLDHQLATMKADRRSETIKEEIAILTSRTESRKRVLAVSMDHILAGILDKARSVDVALTSWESQEPVPLPETDLHRVTLRLHAKGGYHALAHFLEEIQTFPNKLTLKSLDFHAQERREATPEHPIQAFFELTGFQAAAAGHTEQTVSGKATG